MKATELRDLNDKGLREHIATQRRELFGLRLQHATGELENTAGLRDRQARPRACPDRRAPARHRPDPEERWLRIRRDQLRTWRRSTPRRRRAESGRAAEAARPRRRPPRPTRAPRKERNAAARAAKAKPAAGPRTLEDRLAERAAHSERNAKPAPRLPRQAEGQARRGARGGAGGRRSSTLPSTARAARRCARASSSPTRRTRRSSCAWTSRAATSATTRSSAAPSTLHVHDESNNAHAGDTVRVQECRPMSRTKRWRLLEVLERAR